MNRYDSIFDESLFKTLLDFQHLMGLKIDPIIQKTKEEKKFAIRWRIQFNKAFIFLRLQRKLREPQKITSQTK